MNSKSRKFESTYLEPFVERFAACTGLTPHHRHASHVETLSIADVSQLIDVLATALLEIDGVAEFRRNKALRKACVSVGITEKDLFAVPYSDQQAKVELGDLGELLAVFVLAGHMGKPLETLFARNLLKINPTYSERGIDVICLELADSDETRRLVVGDRLTFVESKASHEKSVSALSLQACYSEDELNPQRIYRELKLLQAKVLAASGKAKAAKRITLFVAEFYRGVSTYAGRLRVLTSGKEPEEYAIQSIVKHLTTRSSGKALIVPLDVAVASGTVFRHRRA